MRILITKWFELQTILKKKHQEVDTMKQKNASQTKHS